MFLSKNILKIIINSFFLFHFLSSVEAQTWGKDIGYNALIEELIEKPEIDIKSIIYIQAEENGWHYRKGTSESSNPSNLWITSDFNEDATWLIGQTPIGYGDNDDNTILNDMRGPSVNGSEPYTSIYLRKKFFVNSLDTSSRLLLKAYVDDGAIIWINGVEVARLHISEGTKTYNSTAQIHEAEWESVIIRGGTQLLNEGENIIAIQAFNQSVTSSDFSIDIELSSCPFRVSLIEATVSDDNFLPEPSPNNNPPIEYSFNGSGPFEENSFLIKTIDESLTYGSSDHALAVGKRFFSNESIVPWVPLVDVYSANQWVYADYLRTGSSLPPKTEESFVQNHSWISYGYNNETNPSEVDNIISIHNEAVRRFDYAIIRDQFIACVGLNNGANTTVPSILSSSYNAISVGNTNGSHSRGQTVSGIDMGTGNIEHDGPGRTKPDIVANDNSTSACTPQVSSAVTFLIGIAKAKHKENALLPEVMKALIMAGASKKEFNNWSRNKEMPIDPVLGAGKINLQNSYHILIAEEQEPESISSNYGWDFGSIDKSSEAFYYIKLEENVSEASFSLNWNRVIRSAEWLDGNPYSESIADMKLELYRKKEDSITLYDISDSKIDNLEHLYLRGLDRGEYLLKVSSDTATNYGLAWRAENGKSPNLSIATDTDNKVLNFYFSHLIHGKTFTLEESTNLIDWTSIHSFTAVETNETFNKVIETIISRSFYRLNWDPIN
ncbi:MAG: hypothetical protein HN584_13580 [Akkermansiaceae bacterium]|jgi:hypothetical protein|nr:hypothetical protein [Akkermansiaceae bacterium]